MIEKSNGYFIETTVLEISVALAEFDFLTSSIITFHPSLIMHGMGHKPKFHNDCRSN